MKIQVPLFKVDEARRLITGIATSETPDHSDEIMDYALSKPNFLKWSQLIEKNSGGKSKGNLRAMHSNLAAGKIRDLRFDDSNKLITIIAEVVDDNEWKKVMKGVYTGFSIGGSYGKTWQDGRYRRYEAIPSEISLADYPQNPDSVITLVKANGVTVELKKGGPGSGEPEGHPFRGNQYTTGSQIDPSRESREPRPPGTRLRQGLPSPEEIREDALRTEAILRAREFEQQSRWNEAQDSQSPFRLEPAGPDLQAKSKMYTDEYIPSKSSFQWDETRDRLKTYGIRSRRGEGGATTSYVTSKMSFTDASATLINRGWNLDYQTADGNERGFSRNNLRLIVLGDEETSEFYMGEVRKSVDSSLQKGGPGSGEKEGHPFRGNQYTTGRLSGKEEEDARARIESGETEEAIFEGYNDDYEEIISFVNDLDNTELREEYKEALEDGDDLLAAAIEGRAAEIKLDLGSADQAVLQDWDAEDIKSWSDEDLTYEISIAEEELYEMSTDDESWESQKAYVDELHREYNSRSSLGGKDPAEEFADLEFRESSRSLDPREFEEILMNNYYDQGEDPPSFKGSVVTYEEGGYLTQDKGLVYREGNKELQFTVRPTYNVNDVSEDQVQDDLRNFLEGGGWDENLRIRSSGDAGYLSDTPGIEITYPDGSKYVIDIMKR